MAEQSFQTKPNQLEDHILPVSGTREGIFSFVQALIKREDAPYIVMPNPFYQIYEGAALLAGQNLILSTAPKKMAISAILMPCLPKFGKNGVIIRCTPGNPTGTVLSKNSLKADCAF